MRKMSSLLLCLVLIFMTFVPLSAFAADESTTAVPTTSADAQSASGEEVPELKSISFNNAKIIGNFSPDVKTYSIVLDDSSQQPTLKSYDIDKNGDNNVSLKIESYLDSTGHPIGVIAELKYTFGTTVYFFNYANAEEYGINGNNRISKVYAGDLCFVYPEINDIDTEYTLYIPSDLTEVTLTATPSDVNAVCDNPPTAIFAENQDFGSLTVTVTATDSSKREYTFEIKRLDKTSNEIKNMNNEQRIALVNSQKFYQKPAFKIALVAVVAGIIIIIVFVKLLKRVTVKASDDDEPEFFANDVNYNVNYNDDPDFFVNDANYYDGQ